jgi:hypothetical protein
VLERHRENHDRRALRGLAVLEARDVGARHGGAYLVRGLRGAVELARSDHDRPTRLGEAQREAEPLIPRSSENGDRVFVHGADPRGGH